MGLCASECFFKSQAFHIFSGLFILEIKNKKLFFIFFSFVRFLAIIYKEKFDIHTLEEKGDGVVLSPLLCSRRAGLGCRCTQKVLHHPVVCKYICIRGRSPHQKHDTGSGEARAHSWHIHVVRVRMNPRSNCPCTNILENEGSFVGRWEKSVFFTSSLKMKLVWLAGVKGVPPYPWFPTDIIGSCAWRWTA